MDQYNALTRELFFANNNVKRFKTLVSMSRVKVGRGAGRTGRVSERLHMRRPAHECMRRPPPIDGYVSDN